MSIDEKNDTDLAAPDAESDLDFPDRFDLPGDDDFSGTQDDSDPMGIEEHVQTRAASRQKRHKVLFVVFLFFCAVLAFLLRDDLNYFIQSSQAQDLGLAHELQERSLEHNSFVKVDGIATDMCIRAEVFSAKLRFFYLLGSKMGARMLIQTTDQPDQKNKGCLGAVDGVFEGRLMDLSRTDRYDAVLEYYRENFRTAPRDGPMYLLENGERPREAWYYPVALAVMLALALFHFFLLWRMRKSKELVADDGGPL